MKEVPFGSSFQEEAMFASSLLVVALMPAQPARPIDFDTEIIPVFTRAGCNGGSCQGAAAGRGGFPLSLLGSDAAADHATIVHDLEGRRVNLAHPAKSLLLLKPTGGLSHQGGVVLDE